MQIIPSIIGSSFDDVRSKIEQTSFFAEWVQIDIADGLFAPTETWPFETDTISDIDALSKVSVTVKKEIHLMTNNPEELIHEWLAQKPERILIHPESTTRLAHCLDAIRQEGVEVGLALLLDTPVEALSEYVEKISVVQLMSIAKIGSYGEAFEPGVIEKIKKLRQMYPHITISVDGGITLETGRVCIEAGADNLVVGSAIFKALDPAGVYQDFLKTCLR